MTFKKDLSYGEKYEELTITLEKPKEIIRAPKEQFKPYDLILDGVKIEVKACRLMYKTGNFCIEHYCNGKPSGINTTDADYYYYYEVLGDDNYNLYKIPVDEIKKQIKNKKYFRNMRGGDGFRSEFFLFKKDIFKNYLS